MADVVERLPFPISKKLASTVDTIISRNGREIHYTVAGVPFRLMTSPELPLSFETAPMQKEQQDNEPEAGEQTLAGWWLRSQVSWHEGAGALFAEARGELRETNQFRESSNVDVWTPGELTLLRKNVPVTGTANHSVAAVPDASVFKVVVGQNGKVVQYNNLDAGLSTTDLYVNGAVIFTQVIASEVYWWAAGNDGKVYSGPIGSTTGSPSVWTLNLAGSGPTRICWAKHRLWAINGHRIYNLDFSTPGVTNHIYSHPSSSWTYTDLCDAPGGVLFSGHGDGSSHLQRITLNTDGSVPTLSGATTTAILPSDEKALRISSLTGSLVCVLTNMGVRVAAAQTSGELVYGPLFMARDTELSGTAKPALTAAGRFWWLSWGEAENKMWRIDSSAEVEEGVFAYASDLECQAPPISISIRNQRPVFATTGGALGYMHATELAEIGYVQTGRIRYRTDEVKTYHYCDVLAAALEGSVTLEVLNDADTLAHTVTWSVQGVALSSAQLPSAMGLQRFVSAKVTLQRDTVDPSLGPRIDGVRVKALPAVRPQRIYTLPLACFDQEAWSTGQREGYDGFARDRYLAVRSAEDAGGVVLLVDYGFPDPLGELCRIESLKFVQLQQPDAHQKDGGHGGVLIVSLRTLT